MGDGAISACNCTSDSFLDMKQKMIEKKTEKSKAKDKAVAVAEMDEVSESPVKTEGAPFGFHPSIRSSRQMGIVSSMNSAKDEVVDNVISEAFLALNLAPGIADKPIFKKLVAVLKTASQSYKPPDRKRLSTDLLDSTTARLRAEEAPVREALLRNGGTVCSDGWDDVGRNHLINMLIGNSKGMFFDGTIELTSADSEDAVHVAQLIIDEIERVGPHLIVQVVTDTCSVMKKAWKLIEKKFPWITCTCCGPHVLSLLLHDMAKIPEVAGVIAKVLRVLNRFWGRKRWPRMKLKEVAAKNHGKKIGLYRAKQTRFAGKVQEMGRMLRLKADLQEVVGSAEYGQQKWALTAKEKAIAAAEEEVEEEEDADVDPIKKILQDEDGFWKPLGSG